MLSEEFKKEALKKRNKLLQCFKKDKRFRTEIKKGRINIIYKDLPIISMSEINKDSTDKDYILICVPKALSEEDLKLNPAIPYETIMTSIRNINIEDYPQSIIDIIEN